MISFVPIYYSKIFSIPQSWKFPLRLFSYSRIECFLRPLEIFHCVLGILFVFHIFRHTESFVGFFFNFYFTIRILSVDVILYFPLIFLAFIVFTLTPLLISSSMDIYRLYSSISFCIFNFYLGCLKLFCLCVMVTGFIIIAFTYIISFKSVRFDSKFRRRSSMVWFANFICIMFFLSSF